MSGVHEGLEARLFEHLGAAAVAVDREGVVRLWNDHAETLFGVSREDAVGHDVVKALHKDELAEVVQALTSASGLDAEVVLRDPLGADRLCFVRVSRLPQPADGAIALAVDISHRRLVEQRLEAQYAAAMVLAVATDVEKATRRFLREVGRAIGWDAGDVWILDADTQVMRFADLWAGPGVKGEHLAEAGRTHAFVAGEGLPGRVLASGGPVWIPDVGQDDNFPRKTLVMEAGVQAAFSFPIRLGDRVLGAMEFFHRDPRLPDEALLKAMDAVGVQFGQFLERATALEAMQESEALKASILKASLEAVIVIDHRGTVIDWNPAAERYFGYSREEALGWEMAEMIVPEDARARMREGLQRFLETGESRIMGRRHEMVAQRRGGARFPVEVTVVRTDLPGPPTFTGYVRDITERKQTEAALVEGERRLRHALEAGGMGAWEWDLGSGRVEWSASLERIHGLEKGSFAGTLEAFEADIHPDDRERVREAVDRALAGPDPYRIEYRIVRPDGSQRWLEAIGDVRRDSSGAPVRMHGVCMDVTDRREAEEIRTRLYEGEQAARAEAEAARARLSFLAEASRILSSSLNLERTLAKLAELAVPRLADWCSVEMVEEGGALKHVALGARDQELRQEVRAMRERYPPDPEGPQGMGRVLGSGEAIIYPEIPDDLVAAAARDEEHRHRLERLDTRSGMIVPLRARGRTLGAMTFASSARRFDDEDLALAQELADRAAVAIDNARLYEERSAIARSLQRSLLPPALPEIPGVDVAARYEPAGEGFQVGGDFYDVFQRTAGEWAIVIGDVCGKGPEAAAVTGLARHTLHAAWLGEHTPSGSLRLLNEALIKSGTDRFCTVAKGRIAPGQGGATLTVACGGHHRPYVLRASGDIEIVGEPGTLLGVFEDVTITDQTVRLGPGDVVIFYTDGVVDDRGGSADRSPRTLMDFLEGVPRDSAGAVADHIEEQVRKANPDGPQDDVAIVVLRVE
ncbi:MAG TPA: PAS domain S-box protein [Actinomycetota bacterium]